ncbi:hypothetical protein [Rhodopirellula halodulae]|uniref:hypothetical protein n=1 Tax=Rhodopirellula halodulae TaxID=2894198 RepID=UPI001E3CCBB1|nr:hypothetical protein [Rhodopirellula sp. JC737]MCC9655289.1 hypothetical protein [Rhodopirellula sp. JC737]
MPSPDNAVETLRPDLATFDEFDLEMQRRGYIASRVMPVFEAGASAGKFGKKKLKDLIARSSEKTARAPGSGYNRKERNFDTASFATQEHGVEEPVDRREAALYASYFDAEQDATAAAYETVLSSQERRVADSLFNATAFASQTTNVSNEWDSNHTTDATPIDDVETAVREVASRTGIWPNALVINRLVFRNLRNLNQIVNRITASGAGNPGKPSDITPQMLASVFDLDYVLVAGNYVNAADEGLEVDLEQIWSNEYAAVTRVATTNSIKDTCFGRIIHWSEDGSMPGGRVESYYEPQSRSDIIRVRHDVDEVILYPELVQLLDNVTTSA